MNRQNTRRSIARFQAASLGQSKAQRHIGLELSRPVVETIGLITPVANGFGSSASEKRISAEAADRRNRAIFGDVNFENYVADAVSG